MHYCQLKSTLLFMDGGFSLWRFTVLVPSLVGWMCSQASWLLVYLPTLMEEGRSYVSQFPLTRRNDKVWRTLSCIASEVSLPWLSPKTGTGGCIYKKRVDLIFTKSFLQDGSQRKISGFIHIEGRLGERRDAIVYKESPSQRSTYQLPFILLGSWTTYVRRSDYRLRAKRIRLKGKDDTIIIKGGRRFSLLLRKTIPLNEKHISSLYYFEYEKENIRQRDSLRIGMLTIDSLLGSYTEMKDWKEEEKATLTLKVTNKLE